MTLLVFTQIETDWYGVSTSHVTATASMVISREHVKLMFGRSASTTLATAMPQPQKMRMYGTAFSSVLAIAEPEIVHYYWKKDRVDYTTKSATFGGAGVTDFR